MDLWGGKKAKRQLNIFCWTFWTFDNFESMSSIQPRVHHSWEMTRDFFCIILHRSVSYTSSFVENYNLQLFNTTNWCALTSSNFQWPHLKQIQVLVAHKLHTQRILHDGQNDRFSWFLALAHRAIFPLDIWASTQWTSAGVTVNGRNNLANLETSKLKPSWDHASKPWLLDSGTFLLDSISIII